MYNDGWHRVKESICLINLVNRRLKLKKCFSPLEMILA